MSGIAFKIFLSFWIVFAVLIASFALVRDRTDVRALDHVRQDGLVAAALFETDPAQCEAFLGAVRDHAHLSISLVDATNQMVCGTRGAADAGAAMTVPVSPRPAVTFIARGQVLPGFAPIGAPPFPYETFAFAVLISGIVCFAMAAYLTRPIREVRDASKRLAEGDLSARAGASIRRRHDEIGDLVRDFDAMASRIELLVHSQKQLLSDISHELRSPLARLKVALELAHRRTNGDAQPDLDRIEKEADRMNDLVGRVLALTRAETAQPGSVAAEAVDIARLVSEIADNANYEAQRDHKRVQVDGSSTAIVSGDRELLASAIDNVVRNAVRHTPPQSTVDIIVEATGTEVRVSVRDHGSGVPPDELTQIFSPFHRVESSRTRRDGGTGLGLAIAQRAVTLHRGTIDASNAADGGLIVSMRVPV